MSFRFLRTSRAISTGLAILVMLFSLCEPVDAQMPADSVAAWTHTLQTGSFREKGDALAALMHFPVDALPIPTQNALIEELRRLHVALVNDTNLDLPNDPDGFSDYYMGVVQMVSGLKSVEATTALAPAVAVSGGIERRVARLGDPAVEAMLPLLQRRYEIPSVLETLALAWFWSDSTGAPLSRQSRAQIVSALVAAAESDSSSDFMGAVAAFRSIGDPSFLPLAVSLGERVDTLGGAGAVVASMVQTMVVPKLSSRAASRSTRDVASGALRTITALCAPPDRTGRARGASCAELANQFEAAVRHIEGGRTTAAQSVLTALARRIDQEYAGNRLTFSEHALLGGNVKMLLERLTP